MNVLLKKKLKPGELRAKFQNLQAEISVIAQKGTKLLHKTGMTYNVQKS